MSRSASSLVALLTASLVALAVGGGGRVRAQAPVDSAADTIVFSSDVTGEFQLYAMPIGGGSQRLVARTESRAFENALACNGRIATVVEVPGSNSHRLWTVHLDGSGLTRLTSGPGDHMPTWRPDGFQIAFSSDPPEVNIHLVNADGTGRQQVTSDPAPEFWPHWSPDAGLFAIQYGQRNGPADIYTVTADGSAYQRVTTTGDALQPRWGTGGTDIAYSRVTRNDSDIWVVNRRTGATRPLVTGAPYDQQPVWYPDGTRIIFVRGTETDGNADIWSVKLDGTGLTNLTNTSAVHEMWPATACLSKEPSTPTTAPPTPTSGPPAPTSTATPLPTPTPAAICVCAITRRMVPAALIDAILADPSLAYGWGIPLDPNRKVGPRNRLRECLSVQHRGIAYHPTYNRPIWRAGCP